MTIKRKPAKRFPFTLTKLAAVKAPASGIAYVYDSKQAGLVVSVTAKGHRAFYLYRKIEGRPRRIKLGDVGIISIEQARKEAAKHLGDIAQGKNPAEATRINKATLTIGQLRELYQTRYAETFLRASTRISEDSLWKRHLAPRVTGHKLTAITTAQVATMHAAIAKGNKKSKGSERNANRAVTYLRRLYRYAAKHYGYTGPNPTEAVRLFPEHERDRFLQPDELPRFLDSLDKQPQPFRDFFGLCLYTGQRSGSLRMMQWDQLDIDAGRWEIPHELAKGKRKIHAVLIAPAIDILRSREANRTSDYVFPALRSERKNPYIGQPTRQFAALCKAAKIKNLTIHDLRRTMGSYQTIGGASLAVVGASLAHRNTRSTQVYARLIDDPIRKSMEKAAAMMQRGGREE